MEIKRFTKIATAGFVLFLAARAQASSYTATSFTFPDPRGGNTYAYAINDSGVVAGSYSVYHATEGYGFTDNAGSFTVINSPDSSGAYGGTFVRGLNNNSSVIGDYHSVSSGEDIGFIYNGSSYTTIDTASLNFNRTTMTSPTGVNDTDQVVGNLTDYATGAKQGFLYNGGALSIVAVPGATVTTVNGVNNSGQIVGTFSDGANHFHGYIFDGSTFSIFNAPNASDTFFQSINNNGQILGSYADVNGTHNFVLNNSIYESIDMPQLAASSIALYGINNSGQIVGTAYGGASGTYGFVLAPVPVPATAWLFASSLLGLAGLRQHSKISHRI